MTHNNMPNIQEYEESERDKQRREALARLVQPVLENLRTLEMSNEYANAQTLLDVVNHGTFKLLVMGEFNAGKSTFINALLRQKVLPSYITPTTAIVNEVKYGDPPRALLHFHEQDKDSHEISIADLEEYVVIKDKAEDEIEGSPYSHIELFWDLDLCRNRVEIIDSPGLNESGVRERVTIDYLRKVDGIVFIMLASRFWTASEQASVELLEKSGHREMFFVLNQFDLIDDDADQEKVRQRAMTKLQPKTKRQDAIHFISARDALRGYTRDNVELVDQSGFRELETVLRTFLWDERSRVKVRRAAQELQLTIGRAQRVIPDKQQLLAKPLEELEQRYQEAQKQFLEVEMDKNEIIRSYERFRRDLKELVRGKAREFFANMEGKIEGWAKEYPLKIKANLDVKHQIETGVNNLAEDLTTKLESELDTWVQSVLTPFIEERFADARRDLERLAENFEADLRRARLQLGITLGTDDLSVGKEGPRTALERILSAAGGFFVSGFAGAGIGAIFGWRELVKAILPQIMTAFVAGALGLPLLPVLIIAAVIQGGLTTLNLLSRIKEETGKAYRNKLREVAGEQAYHIAQQIDDQLAEMQVQIERGIEVQINSVKEQVETVLATQQKGKAEVEAKQNEIHATGQHLHEISVQLIEFIQRLEQPDEGVFHNDH